MAIFHQTIIVIQVIMNIEQCVMSQSKKINKQGLLIHDFVLICQSHCTVTLQGHPRSMISM